jgi:Ras-related protein Rab-8A
MAADAEKRKRLLLSQSQSMSNTINADAATRRVKILMLGDSGVGKSSLMLRWTLDSFSPSLASTVGVNFKSRKVHVANEWMQVQVWDTAGQEQFHKITTSYYKGAQGIMLVYDVSDYASLANVEYWIKNIKSHASDTVQVALIGNKMDLRAANNDPSKRCCETERGQEVAHKFGIPFFETSAKESSNVDVAFLTLVEHIMESGGSTHPAAGGSSSSIAGLIHNGHHHPNGGPNANINGSSGLDRRSIVEKADKPKLFPSFKRPSFTNGSSSGANGNGGGKTGGAVGGGSNGGYSNGGSGAANGEGGDGAPGDKEKCTIS